MRRFHPLLCGFALFAVSCAGISLTKIDAPGELPKDLALELQKKFEVHDNPEIDYSAAPNPSSSVANAKPLTPKIASDEYVSKEKALEIGTKRAKGKKGKKGAEPAPVPTLAAGVPPGPLQYPSRRPARDPIWVGEKMTFDISYFAVAAGEFVLETKPYKSIDTRKVYHVQGIAKSSPVFSVFYRLNDMVESFIDFEGIYSHRFHILLDEKKQQRDALELYDSQKAQTFYWNRWSHVDRPYSETKEFAPMRPFSQDSLSALYFLRTQPLPDGAVLTVPVVSEGKEWEAIVTVVRRERVSSPMGKVNAIVLKPETKYQGVLQKRGDSFLWLTDDDRRIVLRLEAKVKIGTVVASLQKFEPGYPIQSGNPEGPDAATAVPGPPHP